jgi:hypothetical protein
LAKTLTGQGHQVSHTTVAQLLGASAAAPPHMWKEQGQRRALCAILPWTPWVVVTVPALVPCARL